MIFIEIIISTKSQGTYSCEVWNERI